jgi:hypothetical protein
VRLEDGAGDTSAGGDTVGEAPAVGVLVACGVLVAVGVLVVGTALVGVVVGAEVEGVTVDEEPLPDDEELGAGVGLTSTQAARATRKMARRTQVEVRIRRISRTSRISRIRISRSRPVPLVRSVRPARSVPRFPARSAG